MYHVRPLAVSHAQKLQPSLLSSMSGVRPKIRYSRLVPVTRHREETDYRDEQFQELPPQVPVKSILLAIFLFLTGAVLLTLAGLMIAGIFGDTPDASATPLLILGAITFIPGFYHVRVAVYAYIGYLGYTYNDIPHYDD